MRAQTKKGFVLSLLLHIAVVAVVTVLSIVRPPEKPKPAVFEIVSAPPPSAESPVVEQTVDFTVPPPPVEAPPPPPRRDPPPVEPKVTKPVPIPKPAPPKPKPVEPPPKPPEKVSYDQFVEQHGKPKTPKPQQQQPKPVVVPKIQTQFTTNIRESVIDLEAVTNLTDAQQSALDSYIARLKEALRRNWDKPVGLAQSISAVVEFDVAANGRLSNVAITQRSGNGQFDDSVRGAFSSLGSAGSTPDGRGMRLRLTFRMTDQ